MGVVRESAGGGAEGGGSQGIVFSSSPAPATRANSDRLCPHEPPSAPRAEPISGGSGSEGAGRGGSACLVRALEPSQSPSRQAGWEQRPPRVTQGGGVRVPRPLLRGAEGER